MPTSANFTLAFNSRSTNCFAACNCNLVLVLSDRARNRSGLTNEHEHDYEQEHERNGWVAEWSNAHAWKACLPQGNQGSNPCPSARRP